jgi:hypothetical protein
VDRLMPWVTEAHTIPIIEQRELIRGCVRQVLAPVLRAHGLATARVGLDEASIILIHELQQELPGLTIADGDTAMQRARMIKLPASGEHMSPLHRISSEKLIRHGDIVFIDIGASWEGYYGDCVLWWAIWPSGVRHSWPSCSRMTQPRRMRSAIVVACAAGSSRRKGSRALVSWAGLAGPRATVLRTCQWRRVSP